MSNHYELIREAKSVLKWSGKLDLPRGVIADVDERGGATWSPILTLGAASATMWVATKEKSDRLGFEDVHVEIKSTLHLRPNHRS